MKSILEIALDTKSLRAFAKAEELLGDVDKETQEKLDKKYKSLINRLKFARMSANK